MSDLTDFHETHAEAWATIIQEPAFQAAMSLLNRRKMQEIENLPSDEMAKNGPIHIAGLKAHLQHENDLMALATIPDLTFRHSPPETYPDPLTELELPPENGSEEEPPKPRGRRRGKK